MSKQNWKTIWITGASSGLGAGIAKQLAAPGVTLGLVARRKEKLEDLAQTCVEKGATVFVYQCDVSRTEETQKYAQQFIESVGKVDLVIANAGVGAWTSPKTATPQEWAKMAEINFTGVINTVTPFLQTMMKHDHGHIAAISSVAGIRSLPGGPYSATKVAVRYFMDGLRMDLSKTNIKVTTICPGFVETEMVVAGEGKYPFLLTCDEAVKEIMFALEAKKHTYIFPWQWRIGAPLLKLTPQKMISWAMNYF